MSKTIFSFVGYSATTSKQKSNVGRFYKEMARAIRNNNLDKWELACKSDEPHKTFNNLLKNGH